MSASSGVANAAVDALLIRTVASGALRAAAVMLSASNRSKRIGTTRGSCRTLETLRASA
jgi:hypothetical protein